MPFPGEDGFGVTPNQSMSAISITNLNRTRQAALRHFNRDLIQRAQMGYMKNADHSYLDLTQGLSTNPQMMNTPAQGALNASWLDKSVTNKYQSPPSQSQFNFG